MTIEQLGILTGVFSAFTTGCYFIYKKFKELRDANRSKVNGDWGNEGDISPKFVDTHFIEMSLTVDQESGEIYGVLESRQLNKEDTLPTLSVNGKLRFKSGVVRITHVRNGEIVEYGKTRILLKKRLLHWKLKSGIEDLFPKRAVLFKRI